MRSTRLHCKGSQLRPQHAAGAIDETLGHDSGTRSAQQRHARASHASAERLSRKIGVLPNSSVHGDASSDSRENQNGRGGRGMPRQIHEASKEKIPPATTGKLRQSGAGPHVSKRITRSMNILLDDLKTIILQHEGCRKRKKASGLSHKRQQQHRHGRIKSLSQKEYHEPLQQPKDRAEYSQFSSAGLCLIRKFKQTKTAIDKPEVSISLERKRKTSVATGWGQGMEKDHFTRQQDEHPKNPGLTEIRPNEEKYGSPQSAPEDALEVEQVTPRNDSVQTVDAKNAVYCGKHKKIKRGQIQELFIENSKQSCQCKHEVNRLTEYKQSGTKEAISIVETMQGGPQTRVMKRKMESVEHENCRKEQVADNNKASEEIHQNSYRDSLENASVGRRRLRSMGNSDSIEAVQKDITQSLSSKDKFSMGQEIKDGCNAAATTDDDKGITYVQDWTHKDTDTGSQPAKDQARLITKLEIGKLKEISISTKTFKDSVAPLNHEQEQIANHSSGSMGNEAQGIAAKHVVVVGGGSCNISKKIHVDGNSVSDEPEIHMHTGQSSQLECNIQEDPKFVTPSFFSNASPEENQIVPLDDVTEKQNNLQAVFGEDQVHNQHTVDDSDNHFVGFKQKRMTRVLTNLVNHFDSSIGYEKDDYGKSDGILKVDSGRMHFWVAANPKETGGRKMRPRLLYADQPLLILMEGRDQDYYSYDGGLLHQMLVEQETELKSPEKVVSAQAAAVGNKDFQIQGIKRESIFIPLFRALPESDGIKMDMKLEYTLPKSYIKHNESILDEYEAEYDMDEDDEEWLLKTNKIRLYSGLSLLPDSQFEKIIEMLEVKYAQLFDQENAHPSLPEIGQREQNDCNSEEAHESESPNDMAMLAKVQQCLEDCCICNGGENSSFNPVFTCCNCHIIVHKSCYGILETFPSDDEVRNNWICRKCMAVLEDKVEPDVCCSLCCKEGGALKPTVEASKWVHVVCALYTDETYFVDTDAMEPVDGLAAAVARAQKQKCRCCLCGMRGGCLERCCARGCNATFHVSCGVNQGASFQLRHSNQQVVGVRSFCAKHANVAPVAATVKDVVFGNKKERGEHLRGERKHLSLKRKHRDLSRLSVSGSERTTLEQQYEFIIDSELDGHGNQNLAARRGGMSHMVENHTQSQYQESCRVLEQAQIPSGQEKFPATILTLEDVLQIDVAHSYDLEEVYWYWISKKTRLGGFLLHKLQQEQAAKNYCIFNKDEDDDLSSLHMELPSRHGAFNLKAVSYTE